MAAICCICQRNDLGYEERTLPNDDARRCSCRGCGTYIAGNEFLLAKMAGVLSLEQRTALSFAIRAATDLGQTVDLRTDTYEATIKSARLPDALTQSDALIDAIATRTRYGDETPIEHSAAWCARLGFHSWPPMLRMLSEIGRFVGYRPVPTPGDLDSGGAAGGPIALQLTLDGWRLAREIRMRRGPGNQAFVAMWFHDGLKSSYDNAIVPALVETGYTPYRVDFAHHNRRIDDEIISQIRRSQIMVADATGARPSVYYEAGFAEALGLSVIWCCHNTWRTRMTEPSGPDLSADPKLIERRWFECVAFDANHLPFILWDNEAELKKKLVDRIGGLGLRIAT